MAFKLTKAEDSRKTEIEIELEAAVGAVEDERAELQEKIDALVADFNDTVITPLNATLTEARNFIEDIVNERQGDYDDKSERWQDGDNGQNAQAWLQEWESGINELEDVEAVEDLVVEIAIPDAHNIFTGLPTEMGQ